MLAPLIFLLYINNIRENITPHIKLFSDDCLLFTTIESVADSVQNDLCKMSLWARKWQMILNSEKLYTLHMNETQSPLKI